ncbi:tail protein [Schleiferilactobacillus perolens DSM 12744]|uniref:Tail protein n=2 Tax=Schleiferilactobacillus perolens TaxID=100468 RepID=A0A0R1MRJ6_9LACO|nr:tail protein [Schleiferilactobacillus perolens DSM 12744]
MHINYPLELIHPEADVTSVSVPGVNGDIVQDNLRYKNISQPIAFTIIRNDNSPSFQRIGRAITNWVAGNDYVPLISDLIPGYEWEAHVAAAPSMVVTNNHQATVTITFDCKPYLKRLGGQDWQPVPDTPTNLERWSAQPLWHIQGKGNMVLTLNGDDYKLNGIDDEVYIDSERSLVYKDLNDSRAGLAVFPNNGFPSLMPGDNTVKLTGEYSLFEYRPNWRCLA